MEDNSQGASAAATDDHGGAEDTAGTTGADGEPRGENLAQGDEQAPRPGRGWFRRRRHGERLLENSIAEREDGQRLAAAVGILQRRMQDVVDKQREGAGKKRPDHGAKVTPKRQAVEKAGDSVETARIDGGEQNHEGHENRVADEMPGIVKGQA